jgi:plastocyanin
MMFAISVPHKLRLFGIALAVPLSLLLTLTAMFGSSTVQAHHDASAMPSMPADLPSAPTMRQTSTDPAAPSSGVDVSISEFAFNPPVITITAGTVVTWTNQQPLVIHTTTSDLGSSDPWDSGILNQNDIFTKTFNTPGTYPYHCNVHATMHGTVVVLPLPQPPTEVDVTGPSEGAAVLPQPFTATVNPITATQPITYIWQATGQTTLTRTDKGLSDTLAFTWPAFDVGPQMITVTAANDLGSVNATHAITIVPPSNVYLPLVLR